MRETIKVGYKKNYIEIESYERNLQMLDIMARYIIGYMPICEQLEQVLKQALEEMKKTEGLILYDHRKKCIRLCLKICMTLQVCEYCKMQF